jgi:spermidine/putrescine-binding protein
MKKSSRLTIMTCLAYFVPSLVAAAPSISCQNVEVLRHVNHLIVIEEEIMQIFQDQCEVDQTNQTANSTERMLVSGKITLLDSKTNFKLQQN